MIKRFKNYTATIISLFLLACLSIKKIRQIFIYVGVSTFFGYAWTLTVNNVFDVPAWSFTKESFSGVVIFNTILEDFFFYPISSILFLLLIVWSESLIKTQNNAILSRILFLLYVCMEIVFSCVDSIGLSVSLFFAVPSIFLYVLFLYNKIHATRWLFISAIIIPASSLWDLWSTTIAHKLGFQTQWYYPDELYRGWIFNSPISITPWFTIAGILFSYSVYLFVKKYIK